MSVPPHADPARDAPDADASSGSAGAGASAASASERPKERVVLDDRPSVSAHAVFMSAARGLRRPWWRARLPAFMLAGTLLLTVAASSFVLMSLHASDAARFDNAVQSAADRVSGRFDTYVALLYGARGLFAASDDVTAAEFGAYVDRLELGVHYRGVRGIGFSRRLDVGPRVDSAALARAVRRDGSPATFVWPGGVRDEYHAIVYLEPRDARNRAALGYDMHTDPTRRDAMDRARDTGLPAASGVVRLKQEIDADEQSGFLVYVPVYTGGVTPADTAARREALRGFVYAPFRGGDLFAGIFGSEKEPRVAFRVFDGIDTTSTPLYATPGAPVAHVAEGRRAASADEATRLLSVVPLDVGGRVWTLVFTPLPETTASTRNTLIVSAVALFGLLLGALLFQITAAEVRARESAERSDALRGRFFAAMSHELRTPVNAVLGYNDLLLAGVYGPLSSTQEHGIQRSQRAARHLLELVNDVLDLSKLEAGKTEIVVEPVKLEELLEDLLVTIRPLAEERGCELRLDGTDCVATVETDPRRLRQVLLNLLSNATKFGAGHPVELRCARLPHGAPVPTRGRGKRRRTAGDALLIEVTDHGPGIAPADQERIFEEFVQLPGATPGGTGLGLPISRRLAELLGGSLGVTSAPGRGSTFCVTIPVTLPTRRTR
ncbi:CHASE domain protein [Gemmatirosa kalamazoonensis]|uniref:histidine kinase n=1 Tax=Gemmatirosa kalamazoonensis TaxID=861299 RepID=W0RB56_9BACT|nr:CHASE domain-containing protein [Gemmatirosa kalamazoonensis]AHG88026.1 CHASE domain protein [Gemmatirosa kalamazoonensis]